MKELQANKGIQQKILKDINENLLLPPSPVFLEKV